MKDSMKNEMQDMALNLDDLDKVSGGAKNPSGGAVYRLPDNCPNCGNPLIKTRNAKKVTCMVCDAEIVAERIH
ncbi:MAG: hypothetical protein J6N77_02265 [Lachnospiraceae bacterium]|nr:hypothetical protein [Lachnospiraceae bacterium]